MADDTGAGPAGAGGGGTSDGGGAAPGQGMSTGAKVFLACLGLTVVGVVLVAVAVGVLGVGIWRGTESIRENVAEQQEAGEVLREVEAEHPFEPPDDGVVGEERLERFLAVTETAWEEIRPWAEDLRQLREAARGGQRGAGLRELASSARAIGGLAGSRVALAEALAEHDTSLSEYIWTGIQLDRAQDALDGDRSSEGIPEANLELARRHAGELPGFEEGEGEDRGAVLAVAVLWGMTDLSTWEAMGLDTLSAR